jgi:hypothetical protein
MKLKAILTISIIICCTIFIKITIDPIFNIFHFSWNLDKDLIVPYGTIIGGLFGPLFSLISFILVYYVFEEQNKQTFLNKINNDIKYLRDYVVEIKHRNPAKKYIVGNEETGERFFIIAKTQLDKLYKHMLKYDFLDNENIIGATFEIYYFGVNIQTLDTLKIYLSKRTGIDNVNKMINDIREIKAKYNESIFYYCGHQGKLGHYFRQLYYIIESVDNCVLDINKDDIVKSVRIKMSNYEQAVLCYNSFTLMGKNWRKNDYINKYGLIKRAHK